jgi:dUTPase
MYGPYRGSSQVPQPYYNPPGPPQAHQPYYIHDQWDGSSTGHANEFNVLVRPAGRGEFLPEVDVPGYLYRLRSPLEYYLQPRHYVTLVMDFGLIMERGVAAHLGNHATLHHNLSVLYSTVTESQNGRQVRLRVGNTSDHPQPISRGQVVGQLYFSRIAMTGLRNERPGDLSWREGVSQVRLNLNVEEPAPVYQMPMDEGLHPAITHNFAVTPHGPQLLPEAPPPSGGVSVQDEWQAPPHARTGETVPSPNPERALPSQAAPTRYSPISSSPYESEDSSSEGGEPVLEDSFMAAILTEDGAPTPLPVEQKESEEERIERERQEEPILLEEPVWAGIRTRLQRQKLRGVLAERPMASRPIPVPACKRPRPPQRGNHGRSASPDSLTTEEFLAMMEPPFNPVTGAGAKEGS